MTLPSLASQEQPQIHEDRELEIIYKYLVNNKDEIMKFVAKTDPNVKLLFNLLLIFFRVILTQD